MRIKIKNTKMNSKICLRIILTVILVKVGKIHLASLSNEIAFSDNDDEPKNALSQKEMEFK